MKFQVISYLPLSFLYMQTTLVITKTTSSLPIINLDSSFVATAKIETESFSLESFSYEL